MDEIIRILLIEDDEDDFILVRELLAKVALRNHILDWVKSYGPALAAMKENRHDAYLLDYRLDSHDGLQLLREAIAQGCRGPIIFLTEVEDYSVDMGAMKAGATDYLVKGHINPPLLERSIRYAIDRKKAEETLLRSEERLRSLSSELLRAQEKERKTIAAELHDSIAASLSATKFTLERKLHLMKEGGASHTIRLEDVITMVRDTIEETRRIMTNLRPSILDDLGLLPTINWYRREFQKTYPNFQMESSAEIVEEEIPELLKIVIFRVLQEATHNIVKHSKGDGVRIALTKGDGKIYFSVEDNGDGFDVEKTLSLEKHKRGLGLGSMKERVETSGGRFFIDSVPGKGTVMRAEWPV